MENIKARAVLFLVFILFLSSCEKQKTEVFNLNFEQNIFPGIYGDYYIVCNPPEKIDSIISFFNKEVKRTHRERERKIDSLIKDWNIRLNRSKRSEYSELFKDDKEITKEDINRCIERYYKESRSIDSTYKVPKRQPFFSWERWLYIGYDIRYSGYEDDQFIDIYSLLSDKKFRNVNFSIYFNTYRGFKLL